MRMFLYSFQIAAATSNILSRFMDYNKWEDMSADEQNQAIQVVEEIRGVHDANFYEPEVHSIISELIGGFDIDGDNAAIISQASDNLSEDTYVGAFEESAHILQDGDPVENTGGTDSAAGQQAEGQNNG